MCLILVAWRISERYPCVIAANRDEFFARPAEQAHWWQGEEILAGRDLLAGGTWLGVTRTGRFAALTNFRGAARRLDAPSRGALVSEILRSEDSVPQVLEHLGQVGGRYAGFNLMFSDGERLGVYESTTGERHELAPGIYGLSNHLLDTPWPKVLNGKSALASALNELPETHGILTLLRDDRLAAQADLPRTGVSFEWEQLLSSAFIRAAEYGTRCSTLVLGDNRGEVQFTEWTWDGQGEQAGYVSETFTRSPVPNQSHAST